MKSKAFILRQIGELLEKNEDCVKRRFSSGTKIMKVKRFTNYLLLKSKFLKIKNIRTSHV